VHDFNSGILASGLFWTLPIDDDQFWVSRDGRRARLALRKSPVIDSFAFGTPLVGTPASVSFAVEWKATAPSVARGKGEAVPATDPAAFLGSIAPARATGWCSGSEFGFKFRSDPGASSDTGWAHVGRERLGSLL
jgi:hypothetical protein